MNASFNAVQGLETEYACYRGQRQGGENTYRAGERLKNLNGYLLAVEYLADIAAVSDHEEHAAERRADIGEHERVRHRAHYVAPDCQAGFQQLTRREIGRFFVYLAQRRGYRHRDIHHRADRADDYHREDYRLEVDRVVLAEIVEIQPLRVEHAGHFYLITQQQFKCARDEHAAHASDSRGKALDIQALNQNERHDRDIDAGDYRPNVDILSVEYRRDQINEHCKTGEHERYYRIESLLAPENQYQQEEKRAEHHERRYSREVGEVVVRRALVVRVIDENDIVTDLDLGLGQTVEHILLLNGVEGLAAHFAGGCFRLKEYVLHADFSAALLVADGFLFVRDAQNLCAHGDNVLLVAENAVAYGNFVCCEQIDYRQNYRRDINYYSFLFRFIQNNYPLYSLCVSDAAGAFLSDIRPRNGFAAWNISNYITPPSINKPTN